MVIFFSQGAMALNSKFESVTKVFCIFPHPPLIAARSGIAGG